MGPVTTASQLSLCIISLENSPLYLHLKRLLTSNPGISALMHMPMYLGLSMLVTPKFDLPQFCQLIQTHRITFTYIVPPIVLLLAKHPLISQYNLSSLRMMTSAAAPLSADLIGAVWSRLHLGVRQAYGTSETSPGVYMQPWASWQTKAGSCGILDPNMEAKFLSVPSESSSYPSAAAAAADATEVPPGAPGELWVRGPNVFVGYHNNPAATRASLTEDGWYRTGDVGYQDADGFFYATDRVKELIKYKGFQVAPAEMEALLQTHPLVNDVAVVGVEYPSLGTEVPRAYVVPAPGKKSMGTEDEREIREWVAGRVTHHKHLRCDSWSRSRRARRGRYCGEC